MNPIRRFREARGITQRELAEVCFVDVSAVRHWEHNRRDPSASVIIRIATEFGVSADYLLGLTEKEKTL